MNQILEAGEKVFVEHVERVEDLFGEEGKENFRVELRYEDINQYKDRPPPPTSVLLQLPSEDKSTALSRHKLGNSNSHFFLNLCLSSHYKRRGEHLSHKTIISDFKMNLIFPLKQMFRLKKGPHNSLFPKKKRILCHISYRECKVVPKDGLQSEEKSVSLLLHGSGCRQHGVRVDNGRHTQNSERRILR